MLSKLSGIFCFLSLISLIACNNPTDSSSPEKDIDPLQAALPHGDTLPDDNLSDEDHQKLANAIGRKVDTISINNLINMIDSDNKILQAYVFWRLNCEPCFNQHKILQKIQNKSGDHKLKLVFINLDPVNEITQVNASIRAQSISHDAYILSKLSLSDLAPKYRSIFTSKLPAVLLTNKELGTFVLYDQIFEYDELFAVLQPLLM